MNTSSRWLNEVCGKKGSKFEIGDFVNDYNETVFFGTEHIGN